MLLSRADSDAPPKSGFRFIRSCSAALAGVTLEGLEARFGAPVLEAYAMTEAQIIADVNAALTGTRTTMLALATTLDNYNNLATRCHDV